MDRLKTTGLGLIVPLLLIACWELVSILGGLPDYLPPPSAIGLALFEYTWNGKIFVHAGSSVFRVALGFGIGASVGIMVGVLAGNAPVIRHLIVPPIILLNPVPKIAFLPVFVIAFGLGHASKVAIIAVAVFFPTFLAGLEGVAAIPIRIIWSARSMGAGALRIFFRVSLPACLPSILSGLRIGLAISFIVLFTAELMGGDSGLGYIINLASAGAEFDLMMATVAVVALLGFLADRTLLVVRSAALRGRTLGTIDQP